MALEKPSANPYVIAQQASIANQCFLTIILPFMEATNVINAQTAGAPGGYSVKLDWWHPQNRTRPIQVILESVVGWRPTSLPS